jgi:DNA invertase Pin-like site-specific DNA recombinase
MSERTKAGIERAREQGKTLGRPRHDAPAGHEAEPGLAQAA